MRRSLHLSVGGLVQMVGLEGVDVVVDEVDTVGASSCC